MITCNWSAGDNQIDILFRQKQKHFFNFMACLDKNNRKHKKGKTVDIKPPTFPQYLTTELFKHSINFFYQKVNPLMI